MKNSKIVFVIITSLLLSTTSVNTQFFKKLKRAAAKIAAKSAIKNNSKTKAETKEEKVASGPKLEQNEWHKKNVGKVIFYNKSIGDRDAPRHNSNHDSGNDSADKMITERNLAGEGGFAFRAYLEKFYKSYDDTDYYDIKYTMGGKSFTTEDLIKMIPIEYKGRAYSNNSFYDSKHGTVGTSIISGPKKYTGGHPNERVTFTLQEDTFRVLLSKIEDKLKVGAILPLKVEIIGLKGKVFNYTPNGRILASGSINIKITPKSKNLQNLICRCGKSGMNDASVIKEAKEAFKFQFPEVKGLYKVVLLSRDFEQNYDRSRNRNVTSKGMWANFIYKDAKEHYMMVRRYVFFKKIGNSFSKKATIGKHEFYLPVSPLCAK